MESQTKSDRRTRIVRRQINLSFVYKVLAVGFSFFLIPVTLDYLGPVRYGVWATLLSIMLWVSLFDAGLGNGMRNKVAEALASENRGLANIYVSTTYTIIAGIAIPILLIVLFVAPALDFNKIFNTNVLESAEFRWVVITLSALMLVNFVLSLINPVLNASQMTATTVLNQAVANGLALFVVYMLVLASKGGLLHITIGYGLSLILSNLLFTIRFFRSNHDLLPRFRQFDWNKAKNVSLLGVKFYVIQIAVIVIFSTDNIIITQVFGPELVTPYSIVFKLFSVITIVHIVLVTPLWSGATDAYVKGDALWIKKMMRKLNSIMIPIVFIVFLLILFGQDIIRLWIGHNLVIDQTLLVLMGIFILLSIWNNNFAYLINGIGHVNSQLYTAIFAASINIPLSIYFAKYLGLGLNGIVLGTIVSLLFFAVIGPIQLAISIRKISSSLGQT